MLYFSAEGLMARNRQVLDKCVAADMT